MAGVGCCLVCTKYFHTCINCGLMDWEWDYCSPSCFDIAAEQKKAELQEKIIDMLPKESVQWLKDFSNENYGYMFERCFEELLN